MTKDSMFSEKIKRTKLWDKFSVYLHDSVKGYSIYSIWDDTSILEWFLELPFEFQYGVYVKFLMEVKGYTDILITEDTKTNYKAVAFVESDVIHTAVGKSYQKASEEIILKCMDL